MIVEGNHDPVFQDEPRSEIVAAAEALGAEVCVFSRPGGHDAADLRDLIPQSANPACFFDEEEIVSSADRIAEEALRSWDASDPQYYVELCAEETGAEQIALEVSVEGSSTFASVPLEIDSLGTAICSLRQDENALPECDAVAAWDAPDPNDPDPNDPDDPTSEEPPCLTLEAFEYSELSGESLCQQGEPGMFDAGAPVPGGQPICVCADPGDAPALSYEFNLDCGGTPQQLFVSGVTSISATEVFVRNGDTASFPLFGEWETEAGFRRWYATYADLETKLWAAFTPSETCD